MTRRTIVNGVALFVATWVISAGAAEKQATGIVTGNEFADQLYGYRFERLENWKFGKIDKDKPGEPRRLRFTATQTNFLIPENRKTNQENFNPPQIGLWVDTTSLTLEQFAEELKSRKSKLKARKSLGEDFRFLSQGNFEEQMRIQLDGIDGFCLRFTYKYQAQIHNRSTDLYNLIDEVRLGDLYLVKHENRVVVFFYMAERPGYSPVKEEVEQMLSTLKIKPQKADDASSSN